MVDKQDTEPQDSSALSTPTTEQEKNRSKAFSKLKRELSEEELLSPGTQRLLLASLDRLEEQVSELSNCKDRFHEADKERAVLKEKLKTFIGIEIIYGVCLSIGAILIGLIPYALTLSVHAVGSAIILGATGLALIICGVVAKTVRIIS